MAQRVVGATATRFKWTVGGETQSIQVAGDFPVSDSQGQSFSPLASVAIATQPNGQPWTWEAINALANVTIEQDYAADADSRFILELTPLSALVIEVFGEAPEEQPPSFDPRRGRRGFFQARGGKFRGFNPEPGAPSETNPRLAAALSLLERDPRNVRYGEKGPKDTGYTRR